MTWRLFRVNDLDQPGVIFGPGMTRCQQLFRIRPVCLPCLRDGVGDSVHH